MPLVAFNQYFQIGATEAGYTNLAVLRTSRNIKGYSSGGRQLVSPPGDIDPMPGDLRALNAALLTASYDYRRGVVLELVSLQDRKQLIGLPTQGQLLSIVRPILSWAGRIPLGYGFGVAFWSAQTSTDIVRISALVEVPA